MAAVAQIVGPFAERLEHSDGLADGIPKDGPGTLDPVPRDQRRLAPVDILGGLLAGRLGACSRVDEVVGDLKRQSQAGPELGHPSTVGPVRPSQDRPDLAGAAKKRTGLHRLQGSDGIVGQVLVFRYQVDHLATDHAADSGRFGETGGERGAHRGVVVGGGIGQNREGQREQPVAGQDRGRFVESLVNRWLPATEIVVVHGRQIVVDKAVAVNAFERRRGPQDALTPGAEHASGLNHQERAQPFATAQGSVAHRRDQNLARVGAAIIPQRRQKAIEQRLGVGFHLGNTGREVWSHGDRTWAEISRTVNLGILAAGDLIGAAGTAMRGP